MCISSVCLGLCVYTLDHVYILSSLTSHRLVSDRLLHSCHPRHPFSLVNVSFSIKTVIYLLFSFSFWCQVEESEEEKNEPEDEIDPVDEFNVIPPFPEKATVTDLGSETGRVQGQASSLSASLYLRLLLLLLATLSWG
ncbi:GDNF family receptor alpha-3 isoform X1 [Tachysurus ichikawai]